MEMPETECTVTKRQVWNAGRTVGAKRALKPKQIWEIRFYLNQRRRLRDRALFDLAIDSKLRGCDLVQMRIGDLVSGGQVRTRAIVMQQKTGRPVQFELLPDARASLLAWLERRGGTVDDYVFPSRINRDGHLSTRQYARLVDEWVTAVGLMRSEYGTHSLRRTKASIIYRASNLRAVRKRPVTTVRQRSGSSRSGRSDCRRGFLMASLLNGQKKAGAEKGSRTALAAAFKSDGLLLQSGFRHSVRVARWSHCGCRTRRVALSSSRGSEGMARLEPVRRHSRRHQADLGRQLLDRHLVQTANRRP